MRVSATQLSTFQLCPMKWFINKKIGVDPPKSAALEFGSTLHAVMEDYLNNEVVPNDDIPNPIRILFQNAKPIMDDVMEKALDLQVEMQIEGEMIQDVNYLGFIDILADIANFMVIMDHKTSSAQKYFKTEYQLAKDIQMNMYAHHVMENFTGFEGIQVAHIQYLKKAPYSVGVTAHTIEEKGCRAYFSSLQDTARAMLEVEQGVDPKNWPKASAKIPMQSSACSAFGGCPFKPICHQGMDPEKLKAIFKGEEKEMGLPKKSPLTEGNKKMSAIEKMRALKKSKDGAEETPTTEETTTEESQEETGNAKSKAQEILARKRAEKRAAKEAEKKATASEDTGEETPPKDEGGEEAPAGDAGEGAEEQVAAENEKAAESPAPAKKPRTRKKKVVAATFLFWCIPTKTAYVEFRDLIRPWVERTEDKLQVGDIRLPQYNDGIKALCLAKKEILEECNKHEYVLVDERDPVQAMLAQAMDLTNNLCIRSFTR